VVDLGPGTGNQLPHLDRTKLKHVVGLEPNTSFAATLDRNIKHEGLEGLYTVVLSGAEDAELELARLGINPGTVDCILSIQVLCSVKDPAALVKKLHGLLKPGGQFIFWEHHLNERDRGMRWAQCKCNFVERSAPYSETPLRTPRYLELAVVQIRWRMSVDSSNQTCLTQLCELGRPRDGHGRGTNIAAPADLGPLGQEVTMH